MRVTNMVRLAMHNQYQGRNNSRKMYYFMFAQKAERSVTATPEIFNKYVENILNN